MRRVFGVAVLAAAWMTACQAGAWISPEGDVVGTWGGTNVGLIATDSTAHVHIGCESGDAEGPIHLRADGSFDTTGTFTVGAYPIGPGVTHPARFHGVVADGRQMTLTVTLTDTARTFGPVSLAAGAQPQMGPCPICATRNAIRRARMRVQMR